MRRIIASVLVMAMMIGTAPGLSARAAQAGSTGSLSGTATSSGGDVMANASVRVRDLATGRLAGTTTTDAAGQFRFSGLPPGSYAIEVANAAGEIVATTPPIQLAAGAVVSGISVTGAGTAAAAAAAATGGSFFAGTIGIITVAAVGAGVAGVTVAANKRRASASR